jgi:hypothetical protein
LVADRVGEAIAFLQAEGVADSGGQRHFAVELKNGLKLRR